jgi:hypothetical protein
LEGALLQDAIGIAGWDYVDSAYHRDERDIQLRAVDEVSSTQHALAVGPSAEGWQPGVCHRTAKIVLDFATVTHITASFADEIVGKLLVFRLNQVPVRIVLDGLDDGLVRGQTARALTQRREEADAAEQRRSRRSRERGR